MQPKPTRKQKKDLDQKKNLVGRKPLPGVSVQSPLLTTDTQLHVG